MGYRQDGGNTYVKAQTGISQDATRVVKPLIQPLLLNQKLPPFITEQQRKSPTVFIKDTRKTHPVTGQPINPNRDLKTGNYNKAVFEAIIEEAKKLGFNKQQVLDNLLITGQESTWGTTDPELGHALHADYISGTVDGKQVFPPLSETQFQFYEEDPYAKHARAQLMNYYYNAYVLNKPSPKTSMEQRLQFYNTPYPKKGQVTKDTEKNYYKGTNKRFYGVDVTKKPLSMASNPYGKTVASFYPMVANNPEIQYLLYQHGYKKQGGLTKAQTGQQTGWAYDETSNSYLPQFSLPEVQVTAERPGLFKQMRKKFMDSYNPLLPATAQPGLFMEALGVPQQALMYGLTGQYARPSEIYPTKGIGSFGNKFNDFMFDVVTDPLAYLAEASQLRGALRGAKKAPTSLDDFADDLFDEDLFSKEIESAVKQMERDKLKSRLQDLSGRSKVPDQYMIDARGLAAKEPVLNRKSFLSDAEFDQHILDKTQFKKQRDKYLKLLGQAEKELGTTSYEKLFDAFPDLAKLRFDLDSKNLSMPSTFDFFLSPQQLKKLEEQGWGDVAHHIKRSSGLNKRGLESYMYNANRELDPLYASNFKKKLQRALDEYDWHRSSIKDARYSRALLSQNKEMMMKDFAGDISSMSDDQVQKIVQDYFSGNIKSAQQNLQSEIKGIFNTPSAIPSLRGFRPGQMNQMGGLTKHQSKGVVNDERGSLNNMNVSEIWKLVTGSDWSQAKKLGLTDGSYDKNMALRSALLSAIKKNLPPAEKPKIAVAPRPVAQKPKYQVEIPGVQRDATTTTPSGQQRAYEFYSQQPFGLTDPNSRIPKDMQYTMMQTATQPDVVYQTPTGTRSSLQSFYNQLSRSTKNDLANTIIGTVAYPLQAGLNITNAITGDVPIRSDADVANLGWDVAAFVPFTRALNRTGLQARRYASYYGIDPAGYSALNKLRLFPNNISHNLIERFGPTTEIARAERIGRMVGRSPKISKAEAIRLGKNRLDTYRKYLNLSQREGTLQQITPGVYTQPGWQMIEDKQLTNILTDIEKFKRGKKTYNVVTKSIDPNYTYSVFSSDMNQGIRGGFRYDIKMIPGGRYKIKAVDDWDLKPWEKRGVVYGDEGLQLKFQTNIREAKQMANMVASAHYKPLLQNIEVGRIMGGKPFRIVDEFIYDPKKEMALRKKVRINKSK
jgi:hypothetical protein